MEIIRERIGLVKRRLSLTSQQLTFLSSWPALRFLKEYLTSLVTQMKGGLSYIEETLDSIEELGTNSATDVEVLRLLRTDLIKSLDNLESSIFLGIDVHFDWSHAWISQHRSRLSKPWHKFLGSYLASLSEEAGVAVPHLGIFGQEYSNQTVRDSQKIVGHVLTVPGTETASIQRWPILAHEIGHSFFDAYDELITREVVQPVDAVIRRELGSLKHSDYDHIRNAWINDWIPELVSDCVAVRLVGPAFIRQFMLDAASSNPSAISESASHPPMDFRLELQRRALDQLQINYDKDKLMEKWDKYLGGIVALVSPALANGFLNDAVREEATERVLSVAAFKPVERLWPDIEALVNDFNPADGSNRVACVAALGLSPERPDIKGWVRKVG